ncbi:hypothetical protein CFC21_046186 [Triticum aestivum]|uniref:Leucine-rich repeat-containing N-terminal plant-type domain-containing protein n=2 Tax=Triticum aestivum TaxID=4565 RepID=A0A9R1JZF6_WHEAT|nr:hypothetical protein CFC21_046186 [Triticum aestivum]
MACPKPFRLLLLLLQLQLIAVNSLHRPEATFTDHTPASPDQASALLWLKQSFSATNHSTAAFLSWKAGWDCCRWEGVRCRGATGRVASLNLGDRGLESPNLDLLLFELSSLRYLNLARNDFRMSEIPSAGFERLTKLTHLNLSATNFSGQSLSVIDLQHNHLTGPFPEFFVELSSLSVLQLSYNDLHGWVPPSIFQHKRLVTIDLHQIPGLSGTLPNFSADSNLENLLVGNTNFSGSIPSSISNLKSLKKLSLGAQGFVGDLPSSISELKFLSSLQVSGLEVVGSMPPWITNLTSLEVLELSLCGLHGPVPSSICELSKLRILSLYSCNFSGKIPPSSCNISKFPNVLKHLAGIYVIDLSNNQIQGVVPQWAWETWSNSHLFYLNLSHNIFTSVGYDSFLPLGPVDVLDLSFNMFKGPIPIPRSSGSVLDYSCNHFSSMPHNISTQLGKTAIFKASGNQLSRDILPYFCGTKIQFLDLSYNILHATIPSCLMKDTKALRVLNLKENQLQGKLPRDVNNNCMLEVLDFSGNWIRGQLPRSLSSCKKLEVLDVGNNQMNDSFPCWMSGLPGLQVLVLNSNEFFGQVAPSVANNKNNCQFPRLRILDLASNNFSGTLTEEWLMNLKSMMVDTANGISTMKYTFELQRLQQEYQVATTLTYKGYSITLPKIARTLIHIDVSNNAFHGSTPQAIGDLVLLNILNMSHNSLTEGMPSQLGHLKKLESLDLSSNELTGVIPQELASLDFLGTLNLSNNKLEGRIPGSPHFELFSNSSFTRNDGLCGPPLSKKCSNETTPYTTVHPLKENPADIVLFLLSGLGFGVGFAVVIIGTWVLPIRKRS